MTYYIVPVDALWEEGAKPQFIHARMVMAEDYDALRAEAARLRQELAKRDADRANKRRLSRYDR